MGMYLTGYAGPIIRIKPISSKNITEYKINICSGENAPKCPNHREGGKEISGEFCSGCGSKSMKATREKVKETKFNYWNFAQENGWDDDLSTHEYMPTPKGEEWLCDNMNNYYDMPDDVGVCLTLSQMHVSRDMDKFKDEYKVIIEKLQETLGYENVEVDWAVFTYYC